MLFLLTFIAAAASAQPGEITVATDPSFTRYIITGQPAYSPRPISKEDQAAIRRQADLLLLDGPSARWHWPARRNAGVYCGLVNAKNTFGAYTGWHPFYYVGSRLFIIGPDNDRGYYELWCAGAGYIEDPEWIKDIRASKP